MDPDSSILILGGKGMLAHDLAAELRRQGRNFVAVDRTECDITRGEQIRQIVERVRPAVVFNCAAYTAVDQCEDEPEKAFAVNATAVRTLARACKEQPARLVHFSTDFVFDGQSDRPYRPEDRTNPLSVYGLSKLQGEQAIAEVSPPAWLVLRTAWLFGRHGNCFPSKILELARLNKSLRVVNDQLGCPTFTVDLVRAALKLVESNGTGIFHVTNNSPVTWYEFAAATLEEFGLSADLRPVSTEEWFRIRPKQARRPAYSVLDVSACERTTREKLRDWRQALRDFRTGNGQ